MVTISDYSKSNILFLRVATVMFRVLGLAPFSFSSSLVTKNNRTKINIKFIRSHTARIYGLIGYLTVMPIEVYFFSVRYNETLSFMTTMQNYFDIFFALTVQVAQMFIIVLFNMRQKAIVNILNKLVRFEDGMIKNLNDVNTYYSGIYDQVLIFVGFLFIGVAHILSEFMLSKKDAVENIMTFVFPELVIRSFTIQCATILMFMRKKYKILNETLLLHSDSDATGEYRHPFLHVLNISDIEMISKRIAFVREAYYNLNTILSEISKFYSLLISIAIGYYCFEIVYSAYELTIEFKAKGLSNFFIIFNWSLICMACIYPTVVLTNCVTSINEEIKRTNTIIYKLAANYLNHRNIKYQIEELSSELLHKNLDFGAYKLIPLDNSLLTSVFKTALTYVIILLQTVNSKTSEIKSCEETDDRLCIKF